MPIRTSDRNYIDTHIAGTGTSVHGDTFLLNTGDTGTGAYTFNLTGVVSAGDQTVLNSTLTFSGITNPSGTVYGGQNRVNLTNASNLTGCSIKGLMNTIQFNDTTYSQTTMAALDNYILVYGSGSLWTANACVSQLMGNSTGQINDARAYKGYLDPGASGGFTTGYGFLFTAANRAKIGTLYGTYFGDLSGTVTAYWGLYSLSKSYIEENSANAALTLNNKSTGAGLIVQDNGSSAFSVLDGANCRIDLATSGDVSVKGLNIYRGSGYFFQGQGSTHTSEFFPLIQGYSTRSLSYIAGLTLQGRPYQDNASNASVQIAASWSGTTNDILQVSANDYSTHYFRIGAGGNVGIGATPSSIYQLYVERTVTDGSSFGAMSFNAFANASGASANSVYGIFGRAQTSSSNAQNYTGVFYGVDGVTLHRGTGTMSNARAIAGKIWLNSTGNITSSSVFYAETPVAESSGQPVTTHGLYIEPQKLAGGTTAYGIYQSGASDVNYFNGEMHLDGQLNHDGTTVGFYGTAPATQPAHIIDADGTLADITTKFNTLLAQMATTGLQASA